MKKVNTVALVSVLILAGTGVLVICSGYIYESYLLWRVDTSSSKYAAIKELSDRGSKRAVPQYIKALTDKNTYVRRAAIYGLANASINSNEVIMALLGALGDVDLMRRMDAALALKKLVQVPIDRDILREYIGRLVVVGLNDSYTLVRIECIGLIMRVGKDASEAVPMLRKCAGDESGAVRNAAIKAIEAIKNDIHDEDH